MNNEKPNDEMLLEDFVNQEKKKLEQFRTHWLEMHKVEPESFALYMSDGEWFEQYCFWLDELETD